MAASKPLHDRDRVLVYEGHDQSRTQALAAARAHLLSQQVPAFDIDEALVDRQGLVVQAWWGGDAVGFVGEGYPNAQPVTVVNLPGGM